MSIKIVRRVNGEIEITCESTDEAIAFYTALSNGSGAPSLPVKQREHAQRRTQRPPTDNSATRPSKRVADTKQVIEFLRLIESTRGGISAEVIASSLNIRHARGVGGVIRKVKRMLIEEGFAPSLVFSMVGYGKERRWRRKAKLGEAIKKLEQGRDRIMNDE